MIAFPETDNDGNVTRDPRPSVAARYPSCKDYYGKVVKAIGDASSPSASTFAGAFPHCQMQHSGRSDQYK